ncbi:MAG: DUF1206 domain-containing protein [Cyclobacteriaceae bacterium]
MSVTSQALPQTKKWVERFARFGYAAKGAIYIIVGFLAAMAAFGSGGQTTGRSGAFREIAQQPFGQILLGLVAIGFLGYAIWRFIQAIQDAEHEGNDTKGILIRIGYALSGLMYGYFAYYAFQMITGTGGSSSGGSGNQFIVSKLLQQPFGQFLVGVFAAIILAKGIYQMHKATSGKYLHDVKVSHLKKEIKDTYRKLGKFGLIARAIVFGIISVFLGKAAFTANPSEAKGTEGAFDFLVAEGGPIVMGLVAIGFVAYGIFEFFKSRYKPMRTS